MGAGWCLVLLRPPSVARNLRPNLISANFPLNCCARLHPESMLEHRGLQHQVVIQAILPKLILQRSGSGRVVECRTVNQGDGGSIPPTAISKLRQFHSPNICLCLSEETKSWWSLPSGVNARGSKRMMTTKIEVLQSCVSCPYPDKMKSHTREGRGQMCNL